MTTFNSSITKDSTMLNIRLDVQISVLMEDVKNFFEKRQYNEMMNYLKQAVVLGKDSKYQDYVIAQLDVIAGDLLEMFEYSKAKLCLEWAYELSKKQDFQIEALNLEVDMFAHKAKYQEAHEIAIKAFEISKNVMDQITMLKMKALAELSATRYQDAEKTFNDLCLIAARQIRVASWECQKGAWWNKAKKFKEQTVIAKLRGFINTMDIQSALDQCEKTIIKETGGAICDRKLKQLLKIEDEAQISNGNYHKAVEILDRLYILSNNPSHADKADKIKKLILEEGDQKNIKGKIVHNIIIPDPRLKLEDSKFDNYDMWNITQTKNIEHNNDSKSHFETIKVDLLKKFNLIKEKVEILKKISPFVGYGLDLLLNDLDHIEDKLPEDLKNYKELLYLLKGANRAIDHDKGKEAKEYMMDFKHLVEETSKASNDTGVVDMCIVEEVEQLGDNSYSIDEGEITKF
ncbi:hypothetical protein [Candidatus Phycorickettsia trachydisci]|nr:hypothetical protein [Candidatus Phycorickettsia trachydisci]